MTAPNHCAECGAQATLVTQDATQTIPFGQVNWPQTVVHCAACDHQEPLEADDSILSDAIEKARADSVQLMVARLEEHGVSMTQLERAFGLAPRTANGWSEGKISAPALALLRTVATYPWLIELARLDFDPEVADSALLQATESLLEKQGLAIDMTPKPLTDAVDLPH